MSDEGIEGLHDPPTGSFDTAAIAAAGGEFVPRARRGASRYSGHQLVDALWKRGGTATHRITPTLSGAADDGGYLRAMLGNLYLLFPLVGIVLGLWSGITTSGQAVPPALPLTLLIVVLGALDACSGLFALAAFTFVTLVTGNLFGTHMGTAPPGVQTFVFTVTGLFGLGVLWFGAGLIAERLRPIRVVRGGSEASIWARRIVDFAAIPIIGTMVIWLTAWQMPILTGNAPQELFVSIQDHLLEVKVVAFLALLVRALLHSAAQHHFESRMVEVRREPARSRPGLVSFAFWLIRGAIGFAVLWEFLAFSWMVWVCLCLLLAIAPAAYLGGRLKRRTVSKLAYPVVIVRIMVVIVLGELLLSQLTRHLVNPTPMLGGLLIGVGVVLVLYAFADNLMVVGRRRDMKSAIADAIALILLVLLVDFVLAITVTPFIAPRGVYVAPTGAVFVADTGNNRVVLVWKGGYRETIGAGVQFLRPADVVADGPINGYVYVVDSGNNRIVRLSGYDNYSVGSHTFNLALADGDNGAVSLGNGLNDPQSASVNGLGDVFVADTGNNRIVEFNRKTWKQTTFVKGLDHPLAVLCDPFPFYTSTVYIADTGADEVLEVLPNHKTYVLLKNLDEPAGLAEDPWGNLYVSEMGSGKIVRVTDHGYGSESVILHGLGHPRGLSVDALGNLFIADADSGQVKVVALLREHQLETHGIPDPSAVAVAPKGTVYVTDFKQGWLQEFRDHTLTRVATGLDHPVGVASGPQGDVWVDLKSGRLLLVDPSDGTYRVVAQGLDDPRQLYAAPGGDGAVLVVVRGSGTILQYETNGSSTVVLHGLDKPNAVAEDLAGDLVVALKNGQVYEYPIGGKRQLLFNLRGVTSIAMDKYGNAFIASARYRLIVEHVAATNVDAVVNRDFRSLSGMSSTAKGVLWIADRKSVGLYEVIPTPFYTQL
jgi:sugar lactone lactonase YvrE